MINHQIVYLWSQSQLSLATQYSKNSYANFEYQEASERATLQSAASKINSTLSEREKGAASANKQVLAPFTTSKTPWRAKLG
jgi:hypothetical protein